MVRLAEKLEERAPSSRELPHIMMPRQDPPPLGGARCRLTYGNKSPQRTTRRWPQPVVPPSMSGVSSWQNFKEKGFQRFRLAATGDSGNAGELRADETFRASDLAYAQRNCPHPHSTRRIQFHIDHPLYMVVGRGAARATGRDPPGPSSSYPLTMTGGHKQHSIHGFFRT